jgi:hypothetical protein
VYAACFYDDLYVDFGLSQQTLAAIRGARCYVTNAMYHDALGARSAEVMRELFRLRDDVLD